MSFCFQLDFLFYFDFQMHKQGEKLLAYVFMEYGIIPRMFPDFLSNRFFIGDYIVRPFVSLMTKFEIYNVLSFWIRAF